MEPLFLVTTSCEFTGAQSVCFPSFPPSPPTLFLNLLKVLTRIKILDQQNFLTVIPFYIQIACMSENRFVISTAYAQTNFLQKFKFTGAHALPSM